MMALLQKLLAGILADFASQMIQKYIADPAFKRSVDEAFGKAMSAKTREELADASKSIQDVMVRR